MKYSALVGSAATGLCLGLASPALAATTTTGPPLGGTTVAAAKPATKCLSDLRAFDSQMGKDGYWLGGSGVG